jgi:hypothetical protein
MCVCVPSCGGQILYSEMMILAMSYKWMDIDR